MKLLPKNTNWPRLTIQWGVILFIVLLFFKPSLFNIATPDFEAYCPFGGLQALGSYLLSEALSCTMTSAQIVMGVILFIGVLLFSKLFCSFICPIGTVTEWLGTIGDKFKMRYTIKGIADKALRSLKYILLFITVYFTLQSNELFCKEYDPYYALASGFDTDVVLLYAIISIAVAILGSIFIRLFWCKYLCPLGAISNIFKFSVFFVATLGTYLVLLSFGIEISYVWPLAIASAGGYIIELMGQKSRFFPIAKITRSTSTCTDCQLCTISCPQGIDVAAVETVKHVDCNLCGDCLTSCPVDNTLTINKKKSLKWLPVVAVIVLATVGILMGNIWEIPTIDIKWGDKEEIANADIYTQSGLKNIKCYGSSMAFANKMKTVDGVYGVATFVKHHGIKLYYDAEKLSDERIQELLFTPQKASLRTLKKGVETIYGISLSLDNFFDSYDFSYLGRLLQQKTDAVGVISEFACPVVIKIYFPSEIENREELLSIIESEMLIYKTTSGEQSVELNFEISGRPDYFSVPRKEYVSLLFTPYTKSFNHKSDYSDGVIKTFQIPLGKNSKLSKRYSYIVSHLSNDDGIVEFKTLLDETNNEIVKISYVDTMTTIENIKTSLLSDTLTILYSNGQKKRVINMFDFSEELKDSMNIE